MSLTNPWGLAQSAIKKTIKKYAPLKSDYYSIDGNPCFLPKSTCLVPYSFDEKTQASICGAAFDYAARFIIAKNIGGKKTLVTKELFAERYVTYKAHWLNSEREQEKARAEYQNTITLLDDYVMGKPVSDEMMVDCCIALGKMDLLMRGGSKEKKNPFIAQPSDKFVVAELLELLSVFSTKFMPTVTADSEVVFNPSFGVGSRIVGGADADIFVDGVLYDFKTSKNNGYRVSDSTQILGYYILDSIAKDCNDTSASLQAKQITWIALYKARYGETAICSTSLLSADVLSKIKEDIAYNYIFYNVFHIFCSAEFSKGSSALFNSFISKLSFSSNDFRYFDYFHECGPTYQKDHPIKYKRDTHLQTIEKEIKELAEVLSTEDVYKLFISLIKEKII